MQTLAVHPESKLSQVTSRHNELRERYDKLYWDIFELQRILNAMKIKSGADYRQFNYTRHIANNLPSVDEYPTESFEAQESYLAEIRRREFDVSQKRRELAALETETKESQREFESLQRTVNSLNSQLAQANEKAMYWRRRALTLAGGQFWSPECEASVSDQAKAELFGEVERLRSELDSYVNVG